MLKAICALILLAATAGSGVAHAQAQPLTVEEALDKAMKGHPELLQSRLALRRADRLAQGEESALSPVVSFDGSYLYNEEPTQGLFEEGVRVTNITRGQGQLIKRFDWGLDLTLALDVTRFESEQPFVLPGGVREINRIGPNYQETLSLTLRQPLLRGFGRDVGLASIRTARGQRDLATIQLEAAASQAILEVLLGYQELAFAAEALLVRQRQLEIATEQRQATEALIEAGSLAASEIDVIDGQIVLLEESLLVAENDLLSRRVELARLMGDPAGGAPPPYKPAPTQAPAPLTLSADALIKQAMLNNTQVRVLRQQLAAQKIAAGVSADAALPQLDLTLNFGQNALSEEGFFDAFGQIATLEASLFSAGVLFTMPLDNDRARAQKEADEIELQRIEAQIDALERVIGDQVRDAIRLVELGHKRLKLGQRSAELAQRGLDAEQARFRAGRSTNQQVLQFQDDLQRAQEKVLRARVDLNAAVLQLWHLTGTLLGRHGLEVLP